MDSLGQRLTDASLIGLLVVAPLFLGGRHPLGRWVYSLLILVGVIGLVLSLLGGRRLSVSNALLTLVGLGMLLPGVQCIPLEFPLPDWFAPGTQKLAGQTLLDKGQRVVGTTLSVAPVATQNAWPTVIGYGAFFVCLIVRIRSWRDAERILVILMAGSGLLAVLAIAQASMGNGKFLWVYDHPSRDPLGIPRGPFQNENHLCNVLAITIPIILYFIAAPFANKQAASNTNGTRNRVDRPCDFESEESRQTALQWLSVALLIPICSTIYATPSRGGAAVALAGVLSAIAFLVWRQLGSMLDDVARLRWWRSGWAAMALVATVALAAVVTMMPSLSYWRMKIWLTSLAIWEDFPIMGTGLGTHRYIYRAYFNEYFEKTFATCESSWLQILAETGIVGISLMVAVVVMIGITVTRGALLSLCLRQSLLLGALFGGLAASFLHAFVDFPWHIPACVIPAIALTAVVCRFPVLAQLTRSAHATFSNQVDANTSVEQKFAVAFLLLIGAGFGVYSGFNSARSSFAWDDLRRQFRDDESLLVKPDQQTIFQLQSILRSDPKNIEARLQYLSSLIAAMQHPYELRLNPEKLAREVLSQSLRCRNLVPTDGRPYLLFASTAIQQGVNLEEQGYVLNQAHRLRKVDGSISIQKAIHCIINGDQQGSISHWKEAVEKDPTTRTRAWQILSQLFLTPELLTRIEPDHDAAQSLFRLMVTRQQWQDASMVGAYLCDQAMEEVAAADTRDSELHILRRTVEYAVAVEDIRVKTRLFHELVQRDPNNLDYRLNLARNYLENRQIDEAIIHSEESIRLDPLNHEARELLIQCEKIQRLARSRVPAETQID